MLRLDVPFIANPDDRCVPACVGMVLEYFLPEAQFTGAQREKICGYVAGRGNWPTKHWLTLANMGFDVYVIEDFDLARFAEAPEEYLEDVLTDPAALEFQLTHSDLAAEAERADQFLRSGLPYENRAATQKDIEDFLNNGWLVRLEVNASPLAGVSGYNPHSVLAIGYDADGVLLHNPDGQNGNKPEQYVAWPLFMQAWREMGGSFSLNAYRLQS